MIGILLFGLVMLLIGALGGFSLGIAYAAHCNRPARHSPAPRTEVEMNGTWVEVNS